MSGNAKSGRLCRCGHVYAAHEHYRPGTECSLCADCPRYRSASGLGALIAGLLTRRRAAERQPHARRDRRLDEKPEAERTWLDATAESSPTGRRRNMA